MTAFDIDLRPGGCFNTRFDVDGAEIDNRGVYLEVIPQEKLVFADAYTEGWKPVPDSFMMAILLLSDAGEGQTSYTAIARHRTAELRQMHEDMGFFDGWGTAATQLETYARTLM